VRRQPQAAVGVTASRAYSTSTILSPSLRA
jgi:hypothetical protein